MSKRPLVSISRTLSVLDARYNALTEQDRTTPWVAVSAPHMDGRWSVGPDHEMGHRAELMDWCDNEAALLAALVNAYPLLRAVVEAAQDVRPLLFAPHKFLEDKAEAVERFDAALAALDDVGAGPATAMPEPSDEARRKGEPSPAPATSLDGGA